MLEIRALSKSYGKKPVLNDLALNLKKGEILGVFGRNGCGKSTLLNILFGTLKANNMLLTIDGKSFRSSEIISKQLIGYVPQFPFLPQSAKVRDIIPMYYESGEAQDLIFRSQRIAQISNTQVGKLSVGERRYLETLLVGHLDHPYLLLDEPFSMLEPLYKELVTDFLTKLKETKGILLTDHYYQDVWLVSDRKAVLTAGNLHAVSEIQELHDLGYLRKV